MRGRRCCRKVFGSAESISSVVSCVGNVARTICCSDNLLLGRGCCMMVASSGCDERTARRIPDEQNGERESSALSGLKSKSTPRTTLPLTFARKVAPGDWCVNEEERCLLECRSCDKINRFGDVFLSMMVARSKHLLAISLVR